MRIKIIASLPKGDDYGIDRHIGEVFKAYVHEGKVIAANPSGADFVLYDGEYEIVEE